MRSTPACPVPLPSADVATCPAVAPALVPGAVQVWHLHAHTASHPILNAAEQARAARMRPCLARDEFLAGRTLLRLLLAPHLQCAPDKVNLALDANGKPFAPDAPGLHFNLAHSHGMVVLALTGEGQLGIDLEYRNPAFTPAEALALARTSFSPAEFVRLASLEPHRQAESFFTTWTIKEALAKADGRGLRLPLDRIASTPAPGVCPAGDEIALPVAARTFYLRTLHLLPGYTAALALSQPRQAVCIFQADRLVQMVIPLTLPRGDANADASVIV